MWCSGNTEPSTLSHPLHVACQQYEKGFPKLLSSALIEFFLLLESKADFCCWSKAVYYAACEVSKVNLGRQRVEA